MSNSSSSHSAVIAQFLRERRSRLMPTAAERSAHPQRRVEGLTRNEVALRAGVSLTWYSWLEMGRKVHATSSTLRAIARALQLNEDETAYLLLLADPEQAAVPLGHTGDIDDATLGRLVDGFRDGPSFVVNRRWNVVASNDTAREIYGFHPSPAMNENIAWRLLHDPKLRELHHDADAVFESVVALVRYNFADDTESDELAEFVTAMETDERFCRAWARCSVGVFAPKPAWINGRMRHFLFIALSVGRQGHKTLVVHLPIESETLATLELLETR